ncbi:hypothetical protein M8J75_005250 [Diaphorina citri]|nr:hypothetical protein M8J75_005250 [Diaphorina citri]
MSQNASENHYRLDLSNGLIIQNVTPDDAGIYFCHGPYEDEYNKYNYLLDVVIKPKNTVIGQSDEDLEHFVSTYLSSPNTNFSSSPLPDFDRLRSIFGVQLTALTAWDHWTPCDPCDNVRRRQARCILKPAVIETVLARLNLTEETERAVYLATFELSCYSIEMREHFPQVFDMLQQIPEFYQVESCFPYGECDPNAGEAKRREPYYRNHYLLPEGSDLFLICPESSTETHIVWRKDGKVIDPTRSAPGGHIIINSFSTLFLVDGSGFETSGNYTCYVDGIRMQETIVRFISGDSIKQAIYRRHMSYLLYIFLLCAIFYIGGLIRAFTRRHTFRQINWDDKQAEDKPRLLEVVEEE